MLRGLKILQKDHKAELWRYLQANPGWHTTSELAVVLGISVRSIRRYAKELIETEAILTSRQGYQSNQAKKSESPATTTSYTNIQRVIVNELTQNQQLNIYDLTERFYLSESTLVKLLHRIQKYVHSFDLKLVQAGDNWSLQGRELDKRRVISDILYQESEQTFIGTEAIQASFPDVSVVKIATNLKALARQANIYLNVFDFNNILLHVAIATHRTKEGYQPISEVDQLKKPVAKATQLAFTQQLIASIEKSEQVQFSSAERDSLCLIIQFSITRQHVDLDDNVQPTTMALVDDLIKYVNTMLNIDLRVLNFREQFAIHIQRLLVRSSQGYVERNPMTARIRKSSPIIYECAVLISNRLAKLNGVTIEDDEIAYIAMHIGNAVSEYINDLHKLYVVVLMPDYQGDNENFISRLERLFSQDIVIGKLVHTPEQLQQYDYPRSIDFVVQVNSEYTLPAVRYTNISQFLTQADYRRVERLVADIKHTQEKLTFTANLREFFPADNFLILDQECSRDQLFKTVCEQLVRKQVVTNSFVQQLIEREQLSSTAFGRVAIPHSLQMSALKTQGYVILAPNGIQWGDHGTEVNVVFLLAVNQAHKQAYRNIFDDLSQVAVDPKNIAELIKMTSYEDFIGELAALL